MGCAKPSLQLSVLASQLNQKANAACDNDPQKLPTNTSCRVTRACTEYVRSQGRQSRVRTLCPLSGRAHGISSCRFVSFDVDEQPIGTGQLVAPDESNAPQLINQVRFCLSSLPYPKPILTNTKPPATSPRTPSTTTSPEPTSSSNSTPSPPAYPSNPPTPPSRLPSTTSSCTSGPTPTGATYPCPPRRRATFTAPAA